MEYYSALKKKEVLTYATTQINLEDMINEISWSQKDKDGMTHFYEVPRDRKEDGGFQGLVVEGGGPVQWVQSFRSARRRALRSLAAHQCECT